MEWIAVSVGILGIAAGLVGFVALRRTAELERVLQNFRRREEEEIRGLSRRVDWISKSFAEAQKQLTTLISAGSQLTEPRETTQQQVPAVSSAVNSSAAVQELPTSRTVDEVIDEADEYVNFDCNHCGQNIEAPKMMIGWKAACPTCGGSIEIPPKSTSIRPAVTEQMVDGLRTGGEDQDFAKGATIRIHISQLPSWPQKSKRQIVIRRKR